MYSESSWVNKAELVFVDQQVTDLVGLMNMVNENG